MACVIGSHVSRPAMHCGAPDAQKIAQRHVTRLAPTPRHTTHRTGGGARRRTGHFRTHGVEHDRWHDRVNGARAVRKHPSVTHGARGKAAFCNLPTGRSVPGQSTDLSPKFGRFFKTWILV